MDHAYVYLTILIHHTNVMFNPGIEVQSAQSKGVSYFICYSQAIPAAAFSSNNLKFLFCENLSSRIVRTV